MAFFGDLCGCSNRVAGAGAVGLPVENSKCMLERQLDLLLLLLQNRRINAIYSVDDAAANTVAATAGCTDCWCSSGCC